MALLIENTEASLAEAATHLHNRRSSLIGPRGFERITDIHGEAFSYAVTTYDEFGREHHYVLPGHTVVAFH